MNTVMKGLVEKVVETTKGHLKSPGGAMPTFFIGTAEGIKIVGAPFSDEEEKDNVAKIIREIAVDAEFVIFVSEIWTLGGDAAKDFEKNRAKYPDGVSSHPNAVEMLMVHVETDEGVEMGTAEIKDREIGSIEWKKLGDYRGRFASFITSSKPMH